MKKYILTIFLTLTLGYSPALPMQQGQKRPNDGKIIIIKRDKKKLKNIPNERYECNKCDKIYGTRQMAEACELTHSVEKSLIQSLIKCPYKNCKERFLTKEAANRHQIDDHPTKLSACPHCNFRFENRHLNEHIEACSETQSQRLLTPAPPARWMPFIPAAQRMLPSYQSTLTAAYQCALMPLLWNGTMQQPPPACSAPIIGASQLQLQAALPAQSAVPSYECNDCGQGFVTIEETKACEQRHCEARTLRREHAASITTKDKLALLALPQPQHLLPATQQLPSPMPKGTLPQQQRVDFATAIGAMHLVQLYGAQPAQPMINHAASMAAPEPENVFDVNSF